MSAESGAYEPVVVSRRDDGRLSLTAWTRFGDGITVVLDDEQVAALQADLAAARGDSEVSS